MKDVDRARRERSRWVENVDEWSQETLSKGRVGAQKGTLGVGRRRQGRTQSSLKSQSCEVEGHYRKRALPLYYAISRVRASICSICSNILPRCPTLNTLLLLGLNRSSIFHPPTKANVPFNLKTKKNEIRKQIIWKSKN